MRILVTGASGFIGQHVARRLLGAGHEVIATGRSAGALEELGRRGARIVLADLAVDPLEKLLLDQQAVVNCAAMAAPWGRRELFVRNNVLGTERMVTAARSAGVQRLVHLSSPSIYAGWRDQLNVPEEFTPPHRWPSAYAETKWLSERIVLDSRFAALTPVVLRPRAVFGPGDRVILPRILRVARKGVFPLLNGGRALLDITHIDNVVRAVELALTTTTQNTGRAYNITNGEPMPVRELLERIFTSMRLRVRLIALNESIAYAIAALAEAGARFSPTGAEPRLTRYSISLLAHSLTLDITAARQKLGYAPGICLREGFDQFAACWRSDAAA